MKWHQRGKRRRGRSFFRAVGIRRKQIQKQKRRELERQKRQTSLRVAAACASLAEAQGILGISARRLGRWRKQQKEYVPASPGRPECIIPAETKKLLYEHLDRYGANVDLLWRTYPWLSRRSLEYLAARWRSVRTYFCRKTRLFWNGPGTVWAMDCLQRSTTGAEDVLLNVRDLSSGKVLAARLLHSQCMAEVLRVLRELFVLHGRPLVIKCDNGPEFAGLCVREYLKSQGVVQLFSPAYYPQYNGSCEAGGGGVMCRAGEVADVLGRPGELDQDILEAARLQGNAATRRQRPSPDTEWSQRSSISEEERADFLQLVAREQMRAGKELQEIAESLKARKTQAENEGRCPGKEIDVAGKSARIGIERALACAGILQVRRSRFPLLKKSR